MTVACWFSLFFSLFTLLYYFVGMQAGKKTQTANDYFLAGRNLGFWSLTGTLLATQIGAGLILGTVDDAYKYGFSGLYYGLGIAVGFAVLGMGIAGSLRRLNVATTAEIFEKYFASATLKKWASFLSIVSLTGIFIAQVVASRKLMVGLGLESDLLFIGFWAVLVAYTTYGGLPAVVATDLLQVSCILAVFLGLFGYLLVTGVLTKEAAVYVLSGGGRPAASSFNVFFSYVGMPFMFSVVEQDLAQRFFSARSSLVATLAAWASAGSILLFAFIPALIGGQAQVSGIAVRAGQSPLILLIVQHLSPAFQALVFCALIAAIASTADSLLCAISSNVVQDFLESPTGGGRRLKSAEVATVVVGVVGVAGSYFATNILGVMIQSYELLVSSILVPVLMCLWGRGLSRLAAQCSVGAGCIAYGVVQCGLVQSSLPSSLIALGAACIAYAFGLLVSRLFLK